MTTTEMMNLSAQDRSDTRPTRSSFSNEDSVVYEVLTNEAATVDAVAQGGAPLPIFSIRRYAYLAAAQAEGKILGDGTCYLEVPGLDGVWADGQTLKEAFTELREVIFEWVAVKYQAGDNDLPVIGDLDLNRG